MECGQQGQGQIAVIEDDRPVNDALKTWLEDILPGCEVRQYFDPATALEAIETVTFDLVVSDVDLGPGTDKYGGVKIARALDTRRVPLLIVSGSPEYDIQHGIFKALDAWDYLQKPISANDFRLQVERAVAFLSRPDDQAAGQAAGMQFPLVPDLSIAPRGPVMWKGRKVHMSISQMDLVEALAKCAGTMVSHQALYAFIRSGKNLENLRVKISAIRKAFEDEDPDFDHIHPVSPVGYLWRLD